MKKKLKKCIKLNVKNIPVYKLVDTESCLFKEQGDDIELSNVGATYLSYSNAKRALSRIDENERDTFKIVELKIKVTNLRIID